MGLKKDKEDNCLRNHSLPFTLGGLQKLSMDAMIYIYRLLCNMVIIRIIRIEKTLFHSNKGAIKLISASITFRLKE